MKTDWHRTHYQNIILLTVNLPLCVIAGTLNILLIFFSFILFNRFGDAPHGFICSMAAADALCTALAGPYLAYLKSLSVYEQTYLSCKLILGIVGIAKRASLLSLALIKFDKVFYIFWAEYYKQWFCKRNCILFSSAVWIASIVSAVAIHEFSWVDLVPDRAFNGHNQSALTFCSDFREVVNFDWFLADSIIFFYVPSLMAIVGTACLFFRSDEDPEAAVSAYSSLWTTVWLLVTLMPVKVYNGLKWINVTENEWIEFALICLESFNAVVNPMISITVQEKYLSEVRGISLFFWKLH